MFEIMIALFFYAFYVALFLWLSLFILRIYFVIKERYNLKERLIILIVPLSIGYYQIVSKNKQSPFYNFIVILTCISCLLASILPIYMHLRLNII
ncbi:MAG: hypothetical protein CVV61_06510 [Tenericutes bacterium HGW-Tenericutes-6]|nr:MAG: hypothetical protein CVV61_06510 [Tenericutes bacterium HGW-Tenericutes-6]